MPTKTKQEVALERLEDSLDAAQAAIKSLRADVSTGGKDLAKTLDKTITSARRDTTKLGKAVRADVADLQKAIVSPPARKRVAAGKAAAKTTAAKTTAAKTTAAKRTAAKRKTTAKSG